MSVVVAYKWAANPQDASVNAAGVIDWSRAKASISDYDPVAIELGRTLADTLGTELVGISVGTEAVGSALAKKGAISRGLDRAVVVADDSVANWNQTKVASALAGLVNQIGDAQVILTGDSSVDEGTRLTSALLAGFLNLPCFQEVTSISVDGANVTLEQLSPTGKRVVTVAGPVVVAVAADATTPRTPGMKDILAAGKKELATVAAGDLELSAAEAVVDSASLPAVAQRTNQVFSGDSAVADLVAALKTNGII